MNDEPPAIRSPRTGSPRPATNRAPKRPRRRPGRGTVIALGTLALLSAVVMLSRGGGSDPMPTETVAEHPVAPVPTAPDEPAVVVPDPRPGNEPSPPRATPAEPEPPAPTPRPARPRPRVISSVVDLFPTGRPVVEFRTVSWPDRERVAENAVVAGQAILSSNGRNAAALVKILRPRMAPNTLKSFRDLAANGDAAPKGVTLKVKILSASLQRDPQTGARSALLVYQRGADRAPATGVLRLEFAPNESVVTNFSISPLQSGSAP